MVSATGIASVLLIIAGISIAVLQVNKKSYEVVSVRLSVFVYDYNTVHVSVESFEL